MNRQLSGQQLNSQSALPSGQVPRTQYVPPFPPQPAPGGGQGIPSLEIQSTIDGRNHTYDLTKPVINIGRDPSNDIVIDASVVSAFHVQIVREDNQLILVHPQPSRPQTTNGLLYQDRHILGNESFRKLLVSGDIFRIGDQHGTLVTLTYNNRSGAPQVAAPDTTISSQPLYPQQAQPNNHHQGQTRRYRQKFRRPTSKEVKISLISTIGVILTTIITAILGPALVNGSFNKPTPTAISTPSIPTLHSSYTGSYSVTLSSQSSNAGGSTMFSSIVEDDQGHVQLDMILNSAYYKCRGSVDTSRNLTMSCTKVGDANFHVVVNGHVSQDNGHLSGTMSASDPLYPSFYQDATWSAQG